MNVDTRRQQGLTLIELMVTLAVAIILTLTVVPAYQGMIATNRIANGNNEFKSFLQLVRSEAMKRDRSVTITSNNGAGANEWGGGATAVDSDGVTVAVLPALNGVTLDSTTGVTTLVFTSRGFLETTPGGNFDLCKDGDTEGRIMTMNSLGHLAVNSTGCS